MLVPTRMWGGSVWGTNRIKAMVQRFCENVEVEVVLCASCERHVETSVGSHLGLDRVKIRSNQLTIGISDYSSNKYHRTF
jgi:hypothetical protein